MRSQNGYHDSAPSTEEDTKHFLLSNDVKVNLALISSVPFKGLHYVRIHWLLDLLKMENSTERCCDWSDLDNLLDWIISHHLNPSFEIMGNPKYMYRHFIVGKEAVETWQNIVYRMILHFIGRYGDKLSHWRFETWNEPDLQQYNILNFSLPEYISYVEGTIKGVREASKGRLEIKLGGPAGLFKNRLKHPLCWGFLEYCSKQRNMCDINFLSFHRKGNYSSLKIVEDTKLLTKEILEGFPNLASLVMVNDESDILSGWWQSEPWRTDVRYAAAVARVIYLFHVSKKILRLGWISNDNAFLNYHPFYFSQRTLTTRFFMNNTKNKHVQFIRKPGLTVMTLLAMLNDAELQIENHEQSDMISVLASKGGNCDSFCYGNVIIISSTDKMEINNTKTKISVTLLFSKHYHNEVIISIYMLSNILPHPSNIWKKHGKPLFPDETIRQEMRDSEGPHRIYFRKHLVFNGNIQVKLDVTQPSVTLINICSEKIDPPGQVTDLKGINITYNEVILVWNDQFVNSRCIRTYVIEFCLAPCRESNFKRINAEDVIMLSFQFTSKPEEIQESVRGLYTAYAIDYWGRKGPSSQFYNYN